MASLGVCLLLSILKENREKDFIQLKKELFFDHEIILYTFVKDFYIKHGLFPTEETISGKFNLSFSEANEPFSYWLDEASKRLTYTALTEMLTAVSPMLTDNPSKAVDFLKSSIFRLENSYFQDERDIFALSDLASSVIEEIKQTRKASGITGIPTGWETLDKITHGYQNGDVYVFAARVKTGKSLCLLFSADQAHKAGYTPIIISMEMKVKQFVKRHLAIRSGIGHNYLKSGLLSGFAEVALNREVNSIKKQHPFYYVEGQLKKNISDFANMITLYRPHIAFIDGGYLIDTESQRRNRWEEMEVLMKQIKSIAMRANIPVVITFQFNKDMLKKKQSEVDLSDIRLSDDIGAIASVGIGIFDRSPYETNVTEDVLISKKYLDIIGGVGREGESGGFYINWDWERMNFSEISSTSEELIPVNSTTSYDFNNLFR